MTTFLAILILVGVGVCLWSVLVLRAVNKTIARVDCAFTRTERELRKVRDQLAARAVP